MVAERIIIDMLPKRHTLKIKEIDNGAVHS